MNLMKIRFMIMLMTIIGILWISFDRSMIAMEQISLFTFLAVWWAMFIQRSLALPSLIKVPVKLEDLTRY